MDSALYHLNNIGEDSPRSPTDKNNRNLSPGSNLVSASASTTTKKPKWTDKLMKFQRSSGKRKKQSNDSTPSSINSFRQSPSMSSVRTHTPPPLDFHHPIRTTSLPRTSSKINDVKSNEKIAIKSSAGSTGSRFPPNVMPYRLHKSISNGKKSYLNKACTLCEEPISNRSHGERIIELECGHLSHQECITVAFMGSSTQGDFHSMFPQCTKCLEEKNTIRNCIPKNDELKDRLVSEILLNQSTASETMLDQQTLSLIPGQSPVSPAHTIVTYDSISPTITMPIDPLVLRQRAPATEQLPSQPQYGVNTNTRQSYYRNNRTSPTVSSKLGINDKKMSFFKSPSENVKKYTHPVPLLRSYFIELLLSNMKTITNSWEIDDKYGLLRMVDMLHISPNNTDYTECWSYLFERALIILKVRDGYRTNQSNISNTKFADSKIFRLTDNIRISAVDSSVVECVAIEENTKEVTTFYITEKLNSDSSQIIQKWISALLDSEMTFSESAFTSTLPLPPVIKRTPEDDSTSTYTGLINQNKIVELSTVETVRNSVIIRRGFVLGEDENRQIDTETIGTVMTSISSILSLKREKPSNIIIILQLDFTKVRSDNEFGIISNSIKAITLKYPLAQFCSVDYEGNVMDYGMINDKIRDEDSIKNWNSLTYSQKFRPEWLKNVFYSNKDVDNLGVVILSNGIMKNNTSILFQDYNCLKSISRRRVNELKIKVGFLNYDYTDKIKELVEVNDWNDLLETICYSFNFTFDNENGTLDTSISDIYNDCNSDDLVSDDLVSDIQSLTTLHITTPVNAFQTGETNQTIATTPSETSQIESLRIDLINENDQTSHEFEDLKIGNMNRFSQNSMIGHINNAIKEFQKANDTYDPEENETPKRLYNYV